MARTEALASSLQKPAQGTPGLGDAQTSGWLCLPFTQQHSCRLGPGAQSGAKGPGIRPGLAPQSPGVAGNALAKLFPTPPPPEGLATSQTHPEWLHAEGSAQMSRRPGYTFILFSLG